MKTLKFISLFFIAICLLSCNKKADGGDGNVKPEKKELTEEEIEARKAAQKIAYNASKSGITDLFEYQGKIKVTPMIPYVEGMTMEEQSIIKQKMLQIVVSNGIGGIGGNPRYIIAPIVNKLNKDVNTTAPVKYLINYEISIFVADILTGTVFAQESFQMQGIGDSETMALVSVFNQIDTKSSKFAEMMDVAKQKIINYYMLHGEDFIKEAKLLYANQDYEKAMAVLASIPVETGEAYDKAIKMMDEITPKYMDKECGLALTKMKAALGSPADVNGYNVEAMAYYSMIPNGSSCKEEADALAKEYKLNIENLRQSKQDYEKYKLECETRKAEVQAQIEAAGNKCLIEQYKKDAAYQRLPWIRKVFYLGDIDPFDGYQPAEEC